MRRSLVILALILVVGPAAAETFRPADLVPQAGISVLDRSTAHARLDRELFGAPHASVVLGRVDVYDRFPYLEARSFQVVSDPAWDRLLFGATERGLDAFDGHGSTFGPLDAPRGLSSDEFGRIYVADSGNDRVLVFATHPEFHELRLEPLFAIEGLKRPHDVAFADGGTPFDASDDRIYVADTGRNRVVRLDLDADGAREVSSVGGLGSGEQRFAGPTAIAVAHRDGHDLDTVYVADSHRRRLVRLVDRGRALHFDGSLDHDLPEITALDTDTWGNVYAASPRGGEVRKFTADLLPVASLREGLTGPRGVHLPRVTVHDHTRGTVTREGRGSAVLVDRWGEHSGLRRVDLGVEIRDLAVDDGALRFTLTDHAEVVARVHDADGRRLLRETRLGPHATGPVTTDLAALAAGLPAGEVTLELEAVSRHDAARTDRSSVHFTTDGDRTARPRTAAVLGASPNPFNPRTTIEFVVPDGPSLEASLEIVDARGRVVRRVDARRFAPGRHGFDWNGRDDAGEAVGSGIYLYRVALGDASFSGKLALVK